jgi:hypothetical protein
VGLNGGAAFNADDTTWDLDFGFAFPFMGSSYTGGSLSSNGYIWLGASNTASGCCDPYLNGSDSFLDGQARIALAWTDWTTDQENDQSTGTIWYNTFSDHIAITFDQANECCSLGSYTMQMVLFKDGHIVFNYADFFVPLANHDVLVGISAGNGVGDPGSQQILSDQGPRTIHLNANQTQYEYIASDCGLTCDPQVAPLTIIYDFTPPDSTVPEPSTYALMGTGVAGLLFFARRRKSAQK